MSTKEAVPAQPDPRAGWRHFGGTVCAGAREHYGAMAHVYQRGDVNVTAVGSGIVIEIAEQIHRKPTTEEVERAYRDFGLLPTHLAEQAS